MSRQPQTTSVPAQVPTPRPAESPTPSVVPLPSQASASQASPEQASPEQAGPDGDHSNAEPELHWVEWLGQERVDARAQLEQRRRYRNHAGVCAVLFGVAAMGLSSFPVLGYGSVVLGGIGLLHAVAGFSNVRAGRANNPITTSVGAGISLAAMILPWIFMTTSLGPAPTVPDRTGTDQTSTSSGSGSGTGVDLTEFANCINRATSPEALSDCK